MQQRVCNEALGTCSHVSQQSCVPSIQVYFAFIFLLLQQGVSYGVSRSSCDNRFLSNIKNDCNSLSNSDEKAWCKVSTDEKAWCKVSTDEKAWGKVRSCVS